MDHDTWPHLKYRGSLFFDIGNFTNDEIEREYLYPGGERHPKNVYTIDSLSSDKIEEDIARLIKDARWESCSDMTPKPG